MAPQAAALAESRATHRRAGRAADESRPSTTAAPAAAADLRQAALPTEVADRLAGLMAGDPALALAVNARLPAARLQSASDLAAYGGTEDGGHTLDIKG